jgi:adenine-specific DNA methylase
MTLDDIRAEGMASRLGAQMTAVVVDGTKGKEYRPPTSEELKAAQEAAAHVDEVFKDIPFGLPTEPLPTKEALGFRVPLYGFDQWYKLFTPRQLVALGTFVKYTRSAREAMRAEGYPPEWVEVLSGYLALLVDRLADRGSMQCIWICTNAEKPAGSFGRFALPITWDFVEVMPWTETAGGFNGSLEHIQEYLTHALAAAVGVPHAVLDSAITHNSPLVDMIITDPPYYDAIPYSDAMDFFYVWLRRALYGLSPDIDKAFQEPTGPKWNHERNDGELIDDDSRFGGDAEKSKAVYEDGMYRSFRACHKALSPSGRLVVVFANKQSNAWETLVSSMILAGFVVDGSWPIQTERGGRLRAQTSAALSSSVWLVCRKQPETARPGWDNQVLEEMHSRIYDRLRTFWDAGIRGPDFVWAATGPALEAYSKHPVVKKADEPNAVLTVSEFLHAVRRIVVDYVVGRVLSRGGESTDAEALDNPTIYYLLHRHDFGLAEAPVGACILYAQSCGLHDRDLVDRYDLLAYGKSRVAVEEEGEDEDAGESSEEETSTSGSTVRLMRWEQRLSAQAGRRKDLGLSVSSRMAPLIDQIHRIMHLWKAGDVQKVDSYLEDQGLRRNPVFPRVLQALIELARKDKQPDEVSLLESIMNHITARGMHPQMRLRLEEAF